MKKLLLLAIIPFIFVACPKDNNNDTKNRNNLLGLFLIDQTSGNCVQLRKTSGATPIYTATGYAVPKGGCNEGTLGTKYTADAATFKNASDAYYDALIAFYKTAAGNACSTNVTSLEALKAQVTVATITASTTNSTTGCGTTVAGNQYCKDENSIAEQKKLVRFVATGDVKADMASAFEVVKSNLIASQAISGFTTENIALTQVLGPAELGMISSQKLFALFSPGDCAKALATANPDVRDVAVRLSGKTLGDLYGVNAANLVPLTFTLSCSYGDSFTETTTSKKCNATYEKF